MDRRNSCWWNFVVGVGTGEMIGKCGGYDGVKAFGIDTKEDSVILIDAKLVLQQQRMNN